MAALPMPRFTRLRLPQLRLPLALMPALALLHASTTLACGPDFPIELLTQRSSTLYGLPSGHFDFEASQLIVPAQRTFSAELDFSSFWFEASPETPVTEQQKQIETQGYSTAQINDWLRARNADSIEQVQQFAASLPEAHRLYLAGAKAFNQGAEQWPLAAEQFKTLLQLGKAGESRAVWAQHMLARIVALTDTQEAARVEFEKVRSLAAAGAPDPLGLAVASFGAQAQLDWFQLNDAQAPQQNALFANRAIALYAEQAGHGSIAGTNSLLVAARYLRKHPEVLEVALQDPLTRKLMLSYAFSRGFEALGESGQEDFYSLERNADHRQFGGVQSALVNPTLLDALLNAASNGQLEGGDRLAAALYRAGRFEAAKRFSDGQNSALASWVKAKLALREGDNKQAASHYASAIKAMPETSNWIERGGEWQLGNAKCRTRAELGTLALGEGDLEQALQLFFDAGPEYLLDLSYLAERVVSTEQLQDFVEKSTAAIAFAKAPAYEGSDEMLMQPKPSASFDAQQLTQRLSLRQILARRLMREGKHQAALVLFDNPDIQGYAKRYADAMQAAMVDDPIAKAQALFVAAQTMRFQGMEIMGYEMAPDFTAWDGMYAQWEADPEATAHLSAVPPDRRDFNTENQKWTTSLESKQVTATQANPNRRYHYRFKAVQLAEQAASLVPARSQAFAATLCQATNWIVFRDASEADRLYRRYLKEGAYVPWGGDFGTTRTCPTPNFERAQLMLEQQKWQARKRTLRKALPYAIGVFGFLIVLGVFLKLRARKAV
jgi:cellulose synthase operon protein C